MSNNQGKKPAAPVKVVAITAVVTLAVAVGGAYLLGAFGGHDRPQEMVAAGAGAPSDGAATGSKERKVLYWKAPMNPTEIYDQPGKSAMGMDLVPVYEDETDEGGAAKSTERKILYWKAPMNPTEIHDAPGKGAMGMDLVPVYEDEVQGGVVVKIDPVTQQNMGVRTAIVEKGALVRTIRTYGHITYDETRTAQVSPKVSGWIEKLYVDFTGQMVKKGDPLFEIYSPELVSAQEEYLVAYRNLSAMENGQGSDLLESARRRLAYWDIPDDQVQAVETSGKVRRTILIRSPFTGVVTHKNAVEGVHVKAGTTIFKIADLSKVWVEAHIYEYELPWVKVGQDAHMTLPYQPGREYTGKVAYVYPYLQRKTRDVVIRMEFANPELELKPDMFSDVKIESALDGEGLLIPAEAVIRSGERNVVFVTRGDGKFIPRDVVLGLTVEGGKIQIISGLAEGEQVVTSGQFLIDSESKLKEAVQKMLETRAAKKAQKAAPKEDDFLKDM